MPITYETSITEGTYKFQGTEYPELEIHVKDSVNGPSALSLLFGCLDGVVSTNLTNLQQGSSSNNIPVEAFEEFLTRALAQLQKEKDNAQPI